MAEVVRRSTVLRCALAWLTTAVVACAPPQGGTASPALLRVGTSADYAPFSYRAAPGAPPTGFDAELAERFAASLGRPLELRIFRWPELLRDLSRDEFELAMSGVTLRTDRSLAGRFSVPVATSGAVALVHEADAARGLDALDHPDVTIAVNRGGHLERVARTRFPKARLHPVERNGDVLAELLERRAQAVISDTLEAPRWLERDGLERDDELVLLGPFTRDLKAVLVRPDLPELARRLDAWLLRSERDGTLARLRTRHFGPGDWTRTATPDFALEAAIAERLALMPLVAEAKRRSGAPVGDLEREQHVLEAASASVERAAHERGVAPPDPARIRAFFRAQIEAAKRIQREQLARAPDASLPEVDLADTIRPALIRIGDRIAMLLVERAIQERSDGD